MPIYGDTAQVIGAEWIAESAEVTRGGYVNSPQDVQRRFIRGPKKLELICRQSNEVVFTIPWTGLIPDDVFWDGGNWIPANFGEKMVKIAGLDSDSDGLYDKYRVFKEPHRDSQGNDVFEHPVPLDFPPIWSSPSPDSHFKIAEELEEVDAFTFVLKPDTDRHARIALAAYAWSVREDKPALFDDLLDVLAEWSDGS